MFSFVAKQFDLIIATDMHMANIGGIPTLMMYPYMGLIKDQVDIMPLIIGHAPVFVNNLPMAKNDSVGMGLVLHNFILPLMTPPTGPTASVMGTGSLNAFCHGRRIAGSGPMNISFTCNDCGIPFALLMGGSAKTPLLPLLMPALYKKHAQTIPFPTSFCPCFIGGPFIEQFTPSVEIDPGHAVETVVNLLMLGQLALVVGTLVPQQVEAHRHSDKGEARQKREEELTKKMAAMNNKELAAKSDAYNKSMLAMLDRQQILLNKRREQELKSLQEEEAILASGKTGLEQEKAELEKSIAELEAAKAELDTYKANVLLSGNISGKSTTESLEPLTENEKAFLEAEGSIELLNNTIEDIQKSLPLENEIENAFYKKYLADSITKRDELNAKKKALGITAVTRSTNNYPESYKNLKKAESQKAEFERFVSARNLAAIPLSDSYISSGRSSLNSAITSSRTEFLSLDASYTVDESKIAKTEQGLTDQRKALEVENKVLAEKLRAESATLTSEQKSAIEAQMNTNRNIQSVIADRQEKLVTINDMQKSTATYYTNLTKALDDNSVQQKVNQAHISAFSSTKESRKMLIEMEYKKDSLLLNIERAKYTQNTVTTKDQNTATAKDQETKEIIISKIKDTKEVVISKIQDTKEVVISKVQDTKEVVISKVQDTKEVVISKVQDTKEVVISKVQDTKEVITSKVQDTKETIASKVQDIITVE